MARKVIARIIGGLGNQLFSYAAARRLALANEAELVLDTATGFRRDSFRRAYQLGAFNVAGREATATERLDTFGRPHRAALRLLSRAMPFERRPYVKQEMLDFDPRLLSRRVRGTLWLEGVWASEGYFVDAADAIRSDFTLKEPPADAANLRTAERIDEGISVGMHVRWFGHPGTGSPQIVTPDFYRRAVSEMKARVPNPHFFVFSDDAAAAREYLALGAGEATFVTQNDSGAGAIADFWLLRRCRHFIIANSTFSWWAAWLGEDKDKIVLCPDPRTIADPAWTISGLLPERWIQL